jgi:hypothetical protein
MVRHVSAETAAERLAADADRARSDGSSGDEVRRFSGPGGNRSRLAAW